VCRELYKLIKIITRYHHELNRHGWDKHDERDFFDDIYKFIPYNKVLGELLHMEIEPSSYGEYSLSDDD
jgi:hypothetical protein